MSVRTQGTGWQVAEVNDVPPVKPDWPQTWKSIRHHFGITAFGINAWTAGDAGDRIINEHTQDDEEELYVVLEGRATFEVGDEKVDAPAGTLVFVSPGERRTAFADASAS